MAANSPDQHQESSPPSADTVEEELLSIAKGWAEAIISNDAARIASFVTDDWVIVSESGVSPGGKFLTLVASGHLTHSAMHAVVPARVRIWGETAVLTSRITSTAHYLGRQTDADEWTTDVFIKQDGRWLCALTHYTAAEPSS
jgi:ketosteroid isomerase-like protein